MFWRCKAAALCAVGMLTIHPAPAASAADCAHATSKVEKSICADKQLRQADKEFTIGYEQLIERLDRRQRIELIDSQKRWLTERDTACDRVPSEGLATCLGDALRKRRTELARAFSDGHRFGSIKLGRPGLSVKVGNETLAVQAARTPDVDILRLIHGNTLIAESRAPFEIDGRGGDDAGEAVVISTHDYGNLGCSEQYLISVRPNEPLRVEALTVEACSLAYSVRKVANRLELTMSPSAGRDGVVKVWKPQNDTAVFERHLQFTPAPGTKMADFQPGTSPTNNEEFYNALKRAAPRDWRAMANALEFATDRDDDADGKYHVLTPCPAGRRGCPSEQAFAAYAVGTGLFYFAYERPNSGAGSGQPDIAYFPGQEKWPTDMAQTVGRWVEGDLRD